MKATRTWIVIANGARAHIVVNDGPGHGIKAIKGLDLKRDHPPTGEMMSDRQGRSFESHGTGRHGMEPHSDPERVEEQKFVQQIADLLDEKLGEESFDRLIITASPTTLGDIRSALSVRVVKIIHAEVPKDLTHLPIAELPDHFSEFLAV